MSSGLDDDRSRPILSTMMLDVEHLDPIERWLLAIEMTYRGPGGGFGAWRPKDAAHQERRFYAKRVEWYGGALVMVGHENGVDADDVTVPLYVLRKYWERCDFGAGTRPLVPFSTPAPE